VTTAITVISIVVGLAVFYTGVRRIEISSFRKGVLSLLEVAILVASVVLLGWLGALVFAAVTVIAFIAWSVYLAAQKETYLVYASTQAGGSKEEMYALQKRLWNGHEAFHILGPVETAQLISLLAQRARSPEEIEAMATPVAMLWVVHRPDLGWLVGRFDSLLRLYDEPASESMRLADTLSAVTKESAATFEEMVEGMCAAVTLGPDEPEG
jgi:hypothetical protein